MAVRGLGTIGRRAIGRACHLSGSPFRKSRWPLAFTVAASLLVSAEAGLPVYTGDHSTFTTNMFDRDPRPFSDTMGDTFVHLDEEPNSGLGTQTARGIQEIDDPGDYEVTVEIRRAPLPEPLNRGIRLLDAGQEHDLHFDSLRLKTGAHSITAIADPEHAVAEFAEDDNQLEVTATRKGN